MSNLSTSPTGEPKNNKTSAEMSVKLPEVVLEDVAENQRLYLQGSININNVSWYRDEVVSVFVDNPQLVELDLSRAEINGSSVIALVIAIQRFAQLNNRSLKIVNPQAKLLKMSEMNGLRDILPFVTV